MSETRNTARRRLRTAFDVLRGRRPRFDYGLLIVLPFVAAAGGALISLAVENVVEGRRTRRAGPEAPPDPGGARRPESTRRDDGRWPQANRR